MLSQGSQVPQVSIGTLGQRSNFCPKIRFYAKLGNFEFSRKNTGFDFKVAQKLQNIQNEQRKSNFASDNLQLYRLFWRGNSKIRHFIIGLPDIEMLFLKDEIDMLIQTMTS